MFAISKQGRVCGFQLGYPEWGPVLNAYTKGVGRTSRKVLGAGFSFLVFHIVSFAIMFGRLFSRCVVLVVFVVGGVLDVGFKLGICFEGMLYLQKSNNYKNNGGCGASLGMCGSA